MHIYLLMYKTVLLNTTIEKAYSYKSVAVLYVLITNLKHEHNFEHNR